MKASTIYGLFGLASLGAGLYTTWHGMIDAAWVCVIMAFIFRMNHVWSYDEEQDNGSIDE